jgi:ubiquinone/menaquinone biosynthesis C-methylase UbiE
MKSQGNNRGNREAPGPHYPRTGVFDWLAPVYDLFMWLLGLPLGGEDRVRNKVLGELAPLEGKRVVELFCGTASLALMAAKAGAIVTGVDLSKGMLRVAREKSRKEDLNLTLVRADTTSLPFSDNSFDRVLISLGLHEVTVSDCERVVKEAYRVLKQRGRAVIFDYHRARGVMGFFENVLCFFIEEETVKGWLAIDIQGLLRKTGFRDLLRSRGSR